MQRLHKAVATMVVLSTLAGCQDGEPTRPNTTPLAAPSLEESFIPTGPSRVGYLRAADGRVREITFVEYKGRALIEGDLDIGAVEDIPTTREAVRLLNGKVHGPSLAVIRSETSARWPGGVVPYVISSDVPDVQRVHDGMKHITSMAPGVKFVGRTTEADYVVIRSNGSGSLSYVTSTGRGGGVQYIYLGDAASWKTMVHEMFHAIGSSHEQNRCDRDNHLIIHWENIIDANEDQYRKRCSADGFMDHGSYSQWSIMHYSAYTFSSNGQPTMSLRNGGSIPNQSDKPGLSQSDINTLQYMHPSSYITIDNTSNTTQARFSASTNWSASDSNMEYHGINYRYASTAAVSDGASFEFYLPSAQTRAVYAWWTDGTNRSTTAPYIVYNASGTKLGTVSVNQQSNGGKWVSLGSFSFTAGWNKVLLSRWTTTGYVVIADAIQIR